MKHELKTSVKHYVESKQLSERQLNDLIELVSTPKKSSVWPRAVAAIVVIAIAIGFWHVSNRDPAAVSLLIAEEVVHNHLKMKPLEVTSHSLQDLRAYFSQLDFPLRETNIISGSNLNLLGGRYCSIQGITAAQLRLRDEKTGDLETLYQAPYNKEMFRELPNLEQGQAPVRHFINGIGVDIWVEKGILFARTYSQI